jgi:hypothetical protein
MAAYTRLITVANLVQDILLMKNTVDKKVFEDLINLYVTEFAAMETAGLASYTVTTGLQATMIARLDNLNDTVWVKIMKNFITTMITEFDSVETSGLSYTKTAGFATNLKKSVQLYCTVIDRIALHLSINSINTEFVRVVSAS